METQQLHRGRLIDHLQLVTPDLEASRRFYGAVLEALGVPIGGEAERFFWADELFVSAVDSIAAQGRPTGRCHLAFQAKDRAMVEALSSRLLCRLPAGPGRQQHRGGLPRRGRTLGR